MTAAGSARYRARSGSSDMLMASDIQLTMHPNAARQPLQDVARQPLQGVARQPGYEAAAQNYMASPP
eukprot:5771647-Pyramimonas_sp.AAC.1